MLGKVKNYVQDQVTLAKLEGVESVGRIISKITILVLIILFALFLLLTVSFAAGYYLSTVYDDYYIGFLIVAGIYLLLILLILIFKKAIQNLIINMIISSALSEPKNQIKRVKKENK